MNVSQDFFLQVHEHINNGNRSKALDFVNDTLEDMLLLGETGKTSGILKEAIKHIGTIPDSIILTLFTVTKPWKQDLVVERKALSTAIKTMNQALFEQNKQVFE